MTQRVDQRVTEASNGRNLKALEAGGAPGVSHSALHAVVLRPAASFGRHPGDDLIRIHDVAGLAVHAVRRVDLQARRLTGLANDFVDVRRTEPRTGMTVLGSASRAAHFCLHDEV